MLEQVHLADAVASLLAVCSSSQLLCQIMIVYIAVAATFGLWYGCDCSLLQDQSCNAAGLLCSGQ